MRHVDLCSGIGGFALGFEWAGLSTPVLFCDIEPWWVPKIAGSGLATQLPRSRSTKCKVDSFWML